MEVKDLLFFNKEGYAINANYNEDLDLWSSKILFDKNSTDTYKTQGLYLFEKIKKTNNTFQTDLEKFQVFNTNDFTFYPKLNVDEVVVTNIETTNNDLNYYTKWIYGNDIEKYFYDQAYCYFENLNNFHNNDFDTVNSTLHQNIFKILKVEVGRILILTNTNNSIPITNILSNNTKVIPINIIEVKQTQTSEPVWNEINLNTSLYKNKKISVITGTNNDNIYTVENITEQKIKEEYILSQTLYTPIQGDILNIELELRTSNIVVSQGAIVIGNTATNQIQVPYIPQFLKIGDLIQLYPLGNNTLAPGNDGQMAVQDIDYNSNIITIIGATLIPEVINAKLVLNSNKFIIQQEVVKDNNNIYSLPLTYFTIVDKYKEDLLNIGGGFELSYTNNNELSIESKYNGSYVTVNTSITDSSNVTTTPINISPQLYDIYPIFVKEDLYEYNEIKKDTELYYRKIVFNSTNIGPTGINININGKNYNMPADIDVNNTIDDWITAYQSELNNIGIQVTPLPGPVYDTIEITTDFPNVPIYTELNFDSITDYHVEYRTIEFNNIKSQLLIDINNQEYIMPFNMTDSQTVTDWVNAYSIILIQYGIIISNTNNVIHFNIKNPEQQILIKYNIGYHPKLGDLSINDLLLATNNKGSIISGNEIKLLSNDTFLNYYSVGQKISINGASKIPQNKSYNIIGLNNNTISLSHQGVFWDDINIPLVLQSDFFIRRPKMGLTDIGNNVQLKWSWKNTITPDFFLYDFTGEQLKHEPDFPPYSGPIPLCGINGEIELKLNKFPNKNLSDIANPLKQQTIFETIVHDLDYTDIIENPNIEPTPIQTFIGYNSSIEGWNKSRLYLEIIENVSYDISTDNMNNNLWVFKDDYVEIQNIIGLNFLELGYRKNQIIEFNFKDVTDDKNLATLKNTGIQYRIKEVFPTKIVFTKNVIEETSVKEVPSSTRPYYDLNGDPIFEIRYLNVQMKVDTRVIAYFDMFGESEGEDERHKISLNNKSKNILKLQDFFIFKDVDIKEEGVDWVFLNRKRKELLEIYPEITNYIGSYKSIIKAINFFGYNDLTFTEYYQNIDPDNKQFGKLFNLELLNIFDKSIKGWTFSNLNHENMRSLGYKKTNLFSLNYSITDKEGNFINAYSHDEVKIKLLGLKKWLTNNLLPIGTKILDVNGKYIDQNNLKYTHETYYNRNFNVEEYASPVDFNIELFKYPSSVDLYNVTVQFFSFEPIEWFQYTIKTFYIDRWDSNTSYLVNDIVLYDNKFYKATTNISIEQQPDIVDLWTQITLDMIQNIQILQDYKTGSNPNVSFDVNKNIDPHFLIETSWHSGYANSFKINKTYSVIPNFFEDI